MMMIIRYVSVVRGWWLAWASNVPRRSGAFIIEIVERAPRIKAPNILPHGKLQWPTISLQTAGAVGSEGLEALEKMGAINTRPSPSSRGPMNDSFQSLGDRPSAVINDHNSNLHHNDKDNGLLNVGDVFRLRSIKFPDYELGLTSERLRDDFYYLGLRKTVDKNADNWCSTLHFSLNTSSGIVF